MLCATRQLCVLSRVTSAGTFEACITAIHPQQHSSPHRVQWPSIMRLGLQSLLAAAVLLCLAGRVLARQDSAGRALLDSDKSCARYCNCSTVQSCINGAAKGSCCWDKTSNKCHLVNFASTTRTAAPAAMPAPRGKCVAMACALDSPPPATVELVDRCS